MSQTVDYKPLPFNGWIIVHHDGSAERTDRLKVDGGWLYRTRLWNKADGTSVALTFAPDTAAAERAARGLR